MSETQTGIGSTRRPTGLPPISLRTALFCFGRVDGRELVENSSSSSGKEAGAGVSVEELIDIARRHQLDAKLIQVGWPELRDFLMTAPVLLVLRNGNAVLALENSPSPAEEIVAFDPLYCDGDAFFLPRDALEAAWDGIALAVRRPSAVERSPTERPFSAARACTLTVTIAPLLLYPIEASRDDFATSLITPAAATEVIRVWPQPEPETVVGQIQPPADLVESVLFSAHAITELLTEASEQDSFNSPPPARGSKTSLPGEPAATAATNLPPPLETRVKSSVTVLRGASATR